jgi:hypothetical protein
MKRFITLFLISLFVVPIMASAGDSAYRIPITITGTNTSYTVGRYEKPRITRISAKGVLPAPTGGTTNLVNLVVLTYGDTVGGTRTLVTLTNNASGNAEAVMTEPYPDLAYGDVITFGYGTATSGYFRVECINRDTRPLN